MLVFCTWQEYQVWLWELVCSALPPQKLAGPACFTSRQNCVSPTPAFPLLLLSLRRWSRSRPELWKRWTIPSERAEEQRAQNDQCGAHQSNGSDARTTETSQNECGAQPGPPFYCLTNQAITRGMKLLSYGRGNALHTEGSRKHTLTSNGDPYCFNHQRISYPWLERKWALLQSYSLRLLDIPVQSQLTLREGNQMTTPPKRR
jgi:hypothetical protein